MPYTNVFPPVIHDFEAGRRILEQQEEHLKDRTKQSVSAFVKVMKSNHFTQTGRRFGWSNMSGAKGSLASAYTTRAKLLADLARNVRQNPHLAQQHPACIIHEMPDGYDEQDTHGIDRMVEYVRARQVQNLD